MSAPGEMPKDQLNSRLEDELSKVAAREREFWAKKFRHWEKCQKQGSSVDWVKGKAFGDCAKVLEENDRWVPYSDEEVSK